MSFKDSIKAIKKIEQETAMKNRGGVIHFVDGDEERLAFFGEKEKVERCICMVAVTMLDSIQRKMPDGMKDATDCLEEDIYYNQSIMKSRKNGHKQVPLPLRDELREEDHFDEIINFITEKARPQKDMDLIMFAMMNGNKTYIIGRKLALSKSICQKINKGDQKASDAIVDKIYQSVLCVVGNYLYTHTAYTKKAIAEFFEIMQQAKSHVQSERSARMIYPNYGQTDSPLIQ